MRDSMIANSFTSVNFIQHKGFTTKNMKQIQKYLTMAVVAAFLSVTTSTYAGECCDKTSKQVKAGKSCEKCLKSDAAACCKEAAGKAAKVEGAKVCTKCGKNDKKPSA